MDELVSEYLSVEELLILNRYTNTVSIKKKIFKELKYLKDGESCFKHLLKIGERDVKLLERCLNSFEKTEQFSQFLGKYGTIEDYKEFEKNVNIEIDLKHILDFPENNEELAKYIISSYVYSKHSPIIYNTLKNIYLYKSGQIGDLDIVKYLTYNFPNNDSKILILHGGVKGGKLNVVEFMMKIINPGEFISSSLLNQALKYGRINIVEFLITKDSNYDKMLIPATVGNHVEMVKWVLEKTYDVLKDLGYEPLWFHKKFQVNTEDTMQECLNNVQISDRFILVSLQTSLSLLTLYSLFGNRLTPRSY